MSAENGFWLMMACLVGACALWVALKTLTAWHEYRAARARRIAEEKIATPPIALDSESLVGAGGAMAHPPTDLRITLQALQHDRPNDPYRFPLGWSVVDGRPALSQARLVRDVNHVLVTGQSDGGKDNLVFGILLSLAVLQNPQRVQFCIIDGKGLDFISWRNKAHTWRLALKPTEIAPTMRALSAERERRVEILQAAGVSKWDNYTGPELPLLVVYVSELSLLQDAMSKTELEQWLNTELSAGRAFGMRYLIATQTASNFATRWRSQISLYLAAFQPSQSQDEPNTGLTTKEIRAAGGMPPSELPAPPRGAGIFTCVFGRDSVTVRAPLLDDTQRRAWMARLPEAPEAFPGVSSHSAAVETLPGILGNGQIVTRGEHGSAEAFSISDEERARIIEAAHQESSRRKVAIRVFGQSGGRTYDKVKKVCDEEGLLTGEPVSAA